MLHLHFPEVYSAKFEPETKMFIFALDISMKYSIVKTLIAWNTQSVFNNILYDAKFVALLLTYVMGKENIQTNNLAKERMRFIRGILELLLGLFFNILTYSIVFLKFQQLSCLESKTINVVLFASGSISTKKLHAKWKKLVDQKMPTALKNSIFKNSKIFLICISYFI